MGQQIPEEPILTGADSLGFAERVDMLAANQLFRLEKQIERRLEELCTIERKLDILDDELDHFIDEYYAEVGDVCAALDEVESKLADFQNQWFQPEPASAALEPDGSSLKATQAAWKASDKTANDKARRSLYRRLVKECHPDVAGEKTEAQERFMQIQHAYEKGSLAALWEAEWQATQKRIRTLDTAQRMQEMMSWFSEMERYGMEVTNRYRQRRESPAAQLLERYMDARLAGRDFMGNLKQRLESRLQASKQHLVSTKIRTLYLEAK